MGGNSSLNFNMQWFTLTFKFMFLNWGKFIENSLKVELLNYLKLNKSKGFKKYEIGWQ